MLDTPPPLDPNEGALGDSCYRLGCQPTVDWSGPKDIQGFPLEITVKKVHPEATFCRAEDCQSGEYIRYIVAAPINLSSVFVGYQLVACMEIELEPGLRKKDCTCVCKEIILGCRCPVPTGIEIDLRNIENVCCRICGFNNFDDEDASEVHVLHMTIDKSFKGKKVGTSKLEYQTLKAIQAR